MLDYMPTFWLMFAKEIHDDLLTVLGSRIKKIRLEKGLSQAALSLDCDMEKSSVSKIESGQVNVSYLTLWRLSRSLKVSLGELCCDNP